MTPIKRIRKIVLGLSQADMAGLTGVTQATVSRWETGELAPSLNELGKIRAEAERRGIAWNDSWFFEPEPAGEAA